MNAARMNFRISLLATALTGTLLCGAADAQSFGDLFKRVAKDALRDAVQNADGKARNAGSRNETVALNGSPMSSPAASTSADSSTRSDVALTSRYKSREELRRKSNHTRSDLGGTCGSVDATAVPYKSVKMADVGGPGVSATDMAAERKVLEAVAQMMDDWQPRGFRASSLRSFNKQFLGSMSAVTNNYEYSRIFATHICFAGSSQWTVMPDNAFKVLVGVNYLFAMDGGEGVGDPPTLDVNSPDYSASRLDFQSLSPEWYASGTLPQKKDGHYEAHDVARNAHLYLFTRNGQLPFRYVTRAQYLQRQILIMPNKRKASPSLSSTYDKELAWYQQQLQRPAEWLQRQALVKSSYDDKDGYYRMEFADDVRRDVRVPVMPNPAYFDRRLPKSAPQLISVYVGESGSGYYYPDFPQLVELIEQNANRIQAFIQ